MPEPVVRIAVQFRLARRGHRCEQRPCPADVARDAVRGQQGERQVRRRAFRVWCRFFQRGLFKDPLKVLNQFAPPVVRRSRIGNHRAVSGAYPMAILADEILTPGTDQIRALIINSGNPVVSGPDGAHLDKALADLDLLVSIDFFQRESHRHAHWLIPGTHMFEREEFYALFSAFFEKPFMQFGQAVVAAPDGVRSEWDFFVDLSLAMKRPFLGLRGLNTVIRLSRLVARWTGNPHHAFNVRWLWAAIIKLLAPIRWKDLVGTPQGIVYGEKRYGEFRAALQTPDKRIHAAPPEFVRILEQRLAEPLKNDEDAYPFRLVNARRINMMNSWLVETVKRTRAFGEYVDINPADAQRLQLLDDQAVKVCSRTGSVLARARLTDEVPPGVVSIDHGWGSRLFDPVGGAEPKAQGVRRNFLIGSDHLDELSGMPNLNGTAVSLQAA